VRSSKREFVAELAIPWRTLSQAGIDPNRMMVNVSLHGPLAAPPRLGSGYEKLIRVAAERLRARRLGVRLHFAELDDVSAGERVFDVKVQGKTVIRGLDVVEQAGGPRRALVKQIPDVLAKGTLVLEFVPHARKLTQRTAPILSAIELIPR